MTLILKINSKKSKASIIQKAASILKQGGLVAFPTDTVYGLGADATNPKAVKKIFKVKKRPLTNPLPVLIARKNDLFKATSPCKLTRRSHNTKKQCNIIKKLINKFWPGALTIVLPKKKIIPNIVTAGLPCVGVRMPASAVTLALIRALGRPLVATSANLHGKPSPRTAAAVKKYLNNKIDLILDGGKTKLGIESTVLDCTTYPPAILRAGAIPKNKLEKIIGKTKTSQ